jgi:hypothetical protein
MVLATHAFAGGILAAAITGNPAGAFAVGIVSHFLLDAIPHWDYFDKLRSSRVSENYLEADMVVNKYFWSDLLIIFADCLFGVILLASVVFFRKYLLVPALFGMIGGIIPDTFHFLYFKIRREPFTSIEKFHHFIHADKKKIKSAPGIAFQLAIMVIIAMAII